MYIDLFLAPCTLLLYYSSIVAKNVKVEIDSDDLVKIINSLLKTDTFRRIAEEIDLKSKHKISGAYYNPYHPEDGYLNESLDLKNNINLTTQTLLKSQSPSIILESTEINKIISDTDLEQENDNFILSQAKREEERITASLKNFGEINNDIKGINESKIIDMEVKNMARKRTDKNRSDRRYKVFQKRFELAKNSNTEEENKTLT